MTNPSRKKMALLQAKHRLKVELLIPGGRWRVSGLTVARNCGYTGKRNRKAALEWVLKELEDCVV